MKPFIFNMFQTIWKPAHFAQPGENSQRCPKRQGFWLSTGVEKPVDNQNPALDAIWSDIPRE
jgi:hypothetical protein